MLFTNHYKILKIKPFTSDTTIKQAYKQLSLQYHPDKLLLNFPECQNNQIRLTELGEYYLSIQTAWTILSNPEMKKIYDHELRSLLLTTEEVHYELNLSDIDIVFDETTDDMLIPCSRCGFNFALIIDDYSDFVIISCEQCNMRHKININQTDENDV